MAKRGRYFTIHGAFGSEAKAKAKHKRVSGSFIRKRTIRGHTRYVVLKPRGR